LRSSIAAVIAANDALSVSQCAGLVCPGGAIRISILGQQQFSDDLITKSGLSETV